MLHIVLDRISNSYLPVTAIRDNPFRCSFRLLNRIFTPNSFFYDQTVSALFQDGSIDILNIVGRSDCELLVSTGVLGCPHPVALMPLYRLVRAGSQEEFLNTTINNAGQNPSIQGYLAWVFNDSIEVTPIERTSGVVFRFSMAIVGRSYNDKLDYITSQRNDALATILIESLKSKEIYTKNYFIRFLQDKNYSHTHERYAIYLNCQTKIENPSYSAL